MMHDRYQAIASTSNIDISRDRDLPTCCHGISRMRKLVPKQNCTGIFDLSQFMQLSLLSELSPCLESVKFSLRWCMVCVCVCLHRSGSSEVCLELRSAAWRRARHCVSSVCLLAIIPPDQLPWGLLCKREPCFPSPNVPPPCPFGDHCRLLRLPPETEF